MKMSQVLGYAVSLLGPGVSWAYGRQGIGDLAVELQKGPVLILTQLVYTAAYLAGVIFLYKAYQQYQGFKACPQFCGISGPLFMTTVGVSLLLLPSLHRLVEMSS